MTTYTICILLLLYNDSAIDLQTHYNLGWLLCYICLAYFAFNTIVSVFYSVKLLLLLCRQSYARVKGLKFKTEVKTIMEKLGEEINSARNLSDKTELAKVFLLHPESAADPLAKHQKKWFVPESISIESIFQSVYDDMGYQVELRSV